MELQDIYKMTTEELWKTYNQILEEINEEGTQLKEIYAEETKKIKEGIKIKIPIWYFTKEWYEEYPSSEKIKVLKYGKYSIKDFMEEKEEREIIMRKIIDENIDEGGATQPRN